MEQFSLMSLEFAREIASAVRGTGGRALIVGGWVRDRLRERPSKDIDLEVFGVSSADERRIVRRVTPGEDAGHWRWPDLH